MSALASLLSVLAWLAKAYPEIRAFLSGLADGDAKCVEQVRSILPEQSESEKALDEIQNGPRVSGYRGIL